MRAVFKSQMTLKIDHSCVGDEEYEFEFRSNIAQNATFRSRLQKEVSFATALLENYQNETADQSILLKLGGKVVDAATIDSFNVDQNQNFDSSAFGLIGVSSALSIVVIATFEFAKRFSAKHQLTKNRRVKVMTEADGLD